MQNIFIIVTFHFSSPLFYFCYASTPGASLLSSTSGFLTLILPLDEMLRIFLCLLVCIIIWSLSVLAYDIVYSFITELIPYYPIDRVLMSIHCFSPFSRLSRRFMRTSPGGFFVTKSNFYPFMKSSVITSVSRVHAVDGAGVLILNLIDYKGIVTYF